MESKKEAGWRNYSVEPPFALTAKLNTLTIRVDRPQLTPEDIKTLEAAQRNNQASE